MKTFEQIIKEGNEGYNFRDVIDNLTDEEIMEAVEIYSKQINVSQDNVKNLLISYIEYDAPGAYKNGKEDVDAHVDKFLEIHCS